MPDVFTATYRSHSSSAGVAETSVPNPPIPKTCSPRVVGPPVPPKRCSAVRSSRLSGSAERVSSVQLPTPARCLCRTALALPTQHSSSRGDVARPLSYLITNSWTGLRSDNARGNAAGDAAIEVRHPCSAFGERRTRKDAAHDGPKVLARPRGRSPRDCCSVDDPESRKMLAEIAHRYDRLAERGSSLSHQSS